MMSWTLEQSRCWHDIAVGMFYRAQICDKKRWEDQTLQTKLEWQAEAKIVLREAIGQGLANK